MSKFTNNTKWNFPILLLFFEPFYTVLLHCKRMTMKMFKNVEIKKNIEI